MVHFIIILVHEEQIYSIYIMQKTVNSYLLHTPLYSCLIFSTQHTIVYRNRKASEHKKI